MECPSDMHPHACCADEDTYSSNPSPHGATPHTSLPHSQALAVPTRMPLQMRVATVGSAHVEMPPFEDQKLID